MGIKVTFEAANRRELDQLIADFAGVLPADMDRSGAVQSMYDATKAVVHIAPMGAADDLYGEDKEAANVSEPEPDLEPPKRSRGRPRKAQATIDECLDKLRAIAKHPEGMKLVKRVQEALQVSKLTQVEEWQADNFHKLTDEAIAEFERTQASA